MIAAVGAAEADRLAARYREYVRLCPSRTACVRYLRRREPSGVEYLEFVVAGIGG